MVLPKSNVPLFYSFLVAGGGVFGLSVSLFRNTNGHSRHVTEIPTKTNNNKTFQASRSQTLS